MAGLFDGARAQQGSTGTLVAVVRPGFSEGPGGASVGGLSFVDGVAKDDGDAGRMP